MRRSSSMDTIHLNLCAQILRIHPDVFYEGMWALAYSRFYGTDGKLRDYTLIYVFYGENGILYIY